VTYRLLAFVGILLIFIGAAAAQTSSTVNVPITVTHGGSCAGFSGSTCPPGFTWTNTVDEEFAGSGSPGNFASDGINWATNPPTGNQNWPKWFTYYREGQEWFYDGIFGGYTAVDCKDMAFESGGYLHIIGHGSIPLASGTAANPASGCEVNTQVSPEPSGGGIFIDALVNYSQSEQYPDFNWLTNLSPTGGSNSCAPANGVEIDIMEVNKSSIFWCNYAGSATIGFTSGWQTGWHEIGMQIEDKSGVTIWVDGTQQGSTQNPYGCTSSAPCAQTNPYFMRFTDGGPSTNSTGSLVKFFRVFTHN
jgi:hypothetical protein